MQKKLIDIIVGARPNFIKAFPLVRALEEYQGLRVRLIHTGQHFDADMSDVFFKDLDMRAPDFHMEIKESEPAAQISEIIAKYAQVCGEGVPAWTVVAGDVTSTLAGALAAHKMGIKVAHLEAGLRSYDRSMPEEINRVLTDQIADLLWTPSSDADENLRKENIPAQRVEMIGNIMIDTLAHYKEKANERDTLVRYGLSPRAYGLVTLHRPSNVDGDEGLRAIVSVLEAMAMRLPLVFPLHPRTRKSLEKRGLLSRFMGISGLIVTDPLGYLDFQCLTQNARLVLTDSGGIQEETTWLGIPCLTLRPNTERPVTITLGTNRLVNFDTVIGAFEEIMGGRRVEGEIPPLWDGKTAERAAHSLALRCGVEDASGGLKKAAG